VRFDEHKVVVGAVDADQAIEAYHANYSDDWQGFGGIDTMSMDEFKDWLALPLDQMIFDSMGNGLDEITDEDIERDPLGVLGVCLSTFIKSTPTQNAGKLTTTNQLVSVALSRKNGNKAFVELGKISTITSQQIEKITGIDVTDWIVNIDESSVRHVMERHGDPITEKKRGQVAVESTDFDRIIEVLDSPDKIELDTKDNNCLIFSKKMDNNFIIVQELRVGRKKISLKTMYKKPLSAPVAPVASQQSTAQASETFGKQDSDPIIAQNSLDVITPTGRDNTVKTAKGTKIGTKFMVIEADQLITSHDASGNANPLFPQELQPRDRSRETSQAWVQRVAASLDPDSLGRTGRADSGAPIIGSDRVVESGNGRSMTIQLAYARGTAEEYRQFIIDDADYFGLSLSVACPIEVA